MINIRFWKKSTKKILGDDIKAKKNVQSLFQQFKCFFHMQNQKKANHLDSDFSKYWGQMVQPFIQTIDILLIIYKRGFNCLNINLMDYLLQDYVVNSQKQQSLTLICREWSLYSHYFSSYLKKINQISQKYKQDLILLLKKKGIDYNQSTFYPSVDITLKKSNPKLSIFTIQVKYGYLCQQFVIIDVQNEFQLDQTSEFKSGQTKQKIKSRNKYKTVTIVRFLFTESNFKAVFAKAVKELFLLNIASALNYGPWNSSGHGFDLIILKQNILLSHSYNFNLNKELLDELKAQQFASIMVPFHVLNILIKKTSIASLKLDVLTLELIFQDFQNAQMIQIPSSKVKRQSFDFADSQNHKYYQDVVNLVQIIEYEMNRQVQEAVKDNLNQQIQVNFQVYLMIVSCKYYLCNAHSYVQQLYTLFVYFFQKSNLYNFQKEIILNFISNLEPRFQEIIVKIMQMAKIQNPQSISLEKDKYLQFKDLQSSIFINKNFISLKNQIDSSVKKQSIQRQRLFLELSEYLQINNNKYQICYRKDQMVRLLKVLQLDSLGFNIFKEAIGFVFSYIQQDEVTLTKVIIFQNTILSCIILQAQHQNLIIILVLRLLKSEIQRILKLRMLMKMLTHIVWIEYKINTSYNYEKLYKQIKSLLLIQLDMYFKSKQFTMSKNDCQFQLLNCFTRYFFMDRSEENYAKLMIYCFTYMKNYEVMAVVLSEDQHCVSILIIEYSLSVLFLQVSTAYRIYVRYDEKVLKHLAKISLKKSREKGYFQFQFYYFIINKLKTETDYSKTALLIYKNFHSLFSQIIPVQNYTISLCHQINSFVGRSDACQINNWAHLFSIYGNSDDCLLLKVFSYIPMATRIFFLQKFVQYSKQKQMFYLFNVKKFQLEQQGKRKHRHCDAISSVNNYIYCYFAVKRVMFQHQNINQQESSLVCCSDEWYCSQIQRIQCARCKMYILWEFKLAQLYSSGFDKNQPSEKNDLLQRSLSSLVFMFKDKQAFQKIYYVLIYFYQIKDQSLVLQQIEYQILIRASFDSIEFVEFYFKFITYVLQYLISVFDFSKISFLLITGIKEAKRRNKCEQYSLMVANKVQVILQTLKLETQFTDVFYYQIFDQLRWQKADNLALMYYLFMANIKNPPPGSLDWVYGKIVANIDNINDRALVRRTIMKRFYKLYIKHFKLKERKVRFVQKKGIIFDLKINSVKRIIKKLLVQPVRIQRVIGKVNKFTFLFYKSLQNFAQNLQIFR